jgi:hypothetical protein
MNRENNILFIFVIVLKLKANDLFLNEFCHKLYNNYVFYLINCGISFKKFLKSFIEFCF